MYYCLLDKGVQDRRGQFSYFAILMCQSKKLLNAIDRCLARMQNSLVVLYLRLEPLLLLLIGSAQRFIPLLWNFPQRVAFV